MTERVKSKEEETNSINNNNSELKNKILNICEPMCLKIVKDKPENIVQFMMKYLRNNYNYSSSLLHSDQKKELSQLKKQLQFFHEQEENFYYMETYHKLNKNLKSPDKKNKSFQKQKQRLPPDEIIPSDDEDYNNPDEIDNRLDDIDYIKEKAKQEIRPDYFEINNPNEKITIKNNKKSENIFQFLKSNLIKSPLFSELSFDILSKCINAMTEENYKAMNDIVKQGDYSDNFYIVLDGELECRMGFTIIKKEGNRTKVEKFDPKLVKLYYPGDYFCELNLLYHMPIRASVKAVTDTKLYCLDRKTYKYILNSSFINKSNNRIELFKKLPIFETFTDEEYEKLSKIVKEEIFHKGETVIKENEYMNNLMIIEEGKCCGYKIIEKGKMPKKTRDYSEEDFFGKTALLKEELSEETIIVSSSIVKFICFDRNTVKNIFGSLEQILMRDVDIYEKYFPPIPEYSENDALKDNTKSVYMDNNVDNNENININNQNIQSRNADKNIIQPEKINSLTYGIDEISKRASKEKEEMYESEIKRLKEEVSLLKNKLGNRTYPELNENNFNENNNNFMNAEFQEKVIRQVNSEKDFIASGINNNMINNELNTDRIINNDNNNLNNIEVNNNFNQNLNNENVDNEILRNNMSNEQNLNREELNNNLNINNEFNNNEINKSNNEIQNQIQANEIDRRDGEFEEVKTDINIENNNQNNLLNNVNEYINEDRFNNNNTNNLINNNDDIINNNNNAKSMNNSNMDEKLNDSQTDSRRNKLHMNKFKNLANLDINIDDINSSQRKRTATNRSIKNLNNFQIESNNSFKNKKIRSEREINNSDSKK